MVGQTGIASGFHRHLTRHAPLYTEMVVADAFIQGARERLLDFDDLI